MMLFMLLFYFIDFCFFKGGFEIGVVCVCGDDGRYVEGGGRFVEVGVGLIVFGEIFVDVVVRFVEVVGIRFVEIGVRLV